MPSSTRNVMLDLILRKLREEHGAAAIVQRQIFPGSTLTIDEPADPVAAIGEAQMLMHTASGLVRDFALKARGAGKSWADLVKPLGIESEDEYADLPAMAFRQIAYPPSQRYDTVYASWECGSCGERVRDTGPYGGHPEDDETGHAEGCARHAGEIAAWQKKNGDD